MLRRFFQSRIVSLLLVVLVAVYSPEIKSYVQKIFSHTKASVAQQETATPAAQDIEIFPTTVDTAKTDSTDATEEQPSFVQKYKGPLSVNNIIDATNIERTKAGLTPLKTNTLLIQSAKKKVDDMIAKNYFEHTSPDGKTVSDLADSVNYKYIILGENLAVGDFVGSADLLDAWMASPGHKANILNSKYQEIGVYAAQGTYEGRTVWFAVQHFGTNQSVCPGIHANLKKEIDTTNEDLKKREAAIEADRKELETPMAALSIDYKDKVQNFNNLVSEYNTLLAQVKTKIGTYNDEVHAFNNCIGVFQKGQTPIAE
ncbi:MAG: CAP domain-containing protein [bacterium]